MKQAGTSSAASGGLHPFKVAGVSISGWYPSAKTPNGRQPFPSQLEFALGLYLEFHPLVVSYQRGDLSPAFARTHKLELPLGTPYAISYAFEDQPHEYLPNYVGMLARGGLLIGEARRVEEKSRERARAKPEAARHLARLKGGTILIGTEENLSRLRQQNLVFLHARRLDFPAFTELAGHLSELWQSQELSVAQVIARLAERRSAAEVEAAAWKLVADAAAQGRLAVDLASIPLSRAIPIRLLAPEAPPMLPEGLPDLLPLPAPAVLAVEQGAMVSEYASLFSEP